MPTVEVPVRLQGLRSSRGGSVYHAQSRQPTTRDRRGASDFYALRGHLVGHGKDDRLSYNTAEFGKNASVREGGAPWSKVHICVKPLCGRRVDHPKI